MTANDHASRHQRDFIHFPSDRQTFLTHERYSLEFDVSGTSKGQPPSLQPTSALTMAAWINPQDGEPRSNGHHQQAALGTGGRASITLVERHFARRPNAPSTAVVALPQGALLHVAATFLAGA